MMNTEKKTPTNDNEVTTDAAVTISLTDLANGLGCDEDNLLMRLAEIFAKRGVLTQ